MNILGLQLGHDGSACIIKDGQISSAIATERLTKVKKDRGVTPEVLDYILNDSDMCLEDVDLVALCNWFWDEDLEGNELFDKSKCQMKLFPRGGHEEISKSEYIKLCGDPNFFATDSLEIEIFGTRKRCLLVRHHLAHCSYSFFTSPCKRAISFSFDYADNVSESSSAYLFDLKDGKLHFSKLQNFSNFWLGSYYGQICDYLGFYPSLDGAGKVMALAQKGEVDKEKACRITYSELSKKAFGITDPFALTLILNGVTDIPHNRVFYPQLKGEGGKVDPKWRNASQWNTNTSKNIAATAQYVLEKSISQFIQDSNFLGKDWGICLSGGVALNCVSNDNLLAWTDKTIHISPACGDDGLSIGAALFAHNITIPAENRDPKPEYSVSEVSFTGRNYDYGGSWVLSALNDNFEKVEWVEATNMDVAELLADGSTVARFSGSSEFGPRALGNRSILANPKISGIRDKLNSKVKFREEFRPYGVSVLHENAHEVFTTIGQESPYMLFATYNKLHEEYEEVCCKRKTRIQTVRREDNESFHELISEFNNLTGVPMLLNTSFNVQGQPIVETPEDAIESFLAMDLDYLYIGGFLVEKIK